MCGYDRYALYLRPLGADGKVLEDMAGASLSQSKWGGLHVTLCGFAAKTGGGCDDTPSVMTHRSSVVTAMCKAVEAAAMAGGGGFALTTEQLLLKGTAEQPVLTIYDGKCPAALHAICRTVREAGLARPRSPESLHISIGSQGWADDVRTALVDAATAWELAVVKCHAGIEPLQVTEVRERRRLE